MKDVVILSAVRTPIGSFGGALQDVMAPELGAVAIKEAVSRAKVSTKEIEACYMGCVLPAGLGQAPARQAALKAGLPQSVCCTTINRVCASGMKSVILAAQSIRCGDTSLMVAGGMENMSAVPYLLPGARRGYRIGNGQLIDSMIHDGLWDAYNHFHMGVAAELCAKEKSISREAQDRYATESYQRALHSIEAGLFKDEIVPVEVKTKRGPLKVEKDEDPFRAKLDKFGELTPVFQKEGTVTAANASSLSDGASALVLSSADYAKERSLKPIARILGHASHAQAPEWFTTAPVGATQKLLHLAGLKVSDIDLFEINEAFSVVALACLQGLGADPAKVNIRGGAVAFGHPLGATGARILTTLVHALRTEKKRLGIATLCIGGGEATAVLLEAL